jgi:hypothetical protein
MSVREARNQSAADLEQFAQVERLFMEASGSVSDRIDAFPKFASRQAIAKFLARYEIFKRILNVNGSIVECGVLHGGGLMTYAKLSSIFEPVNHTRRIIGFDTFSGFASIHDKDAVGQSAHLERGGLAGSPLAEVEAAVALYDVNRPLSHIPKVELVAGDLISTAPAYVEQNPHLIVALLYLDVDLYEPTAAAIRAFLPRMPKGAVIAFDELNAKIFPGETTAALEMLPINKLRIERFPFDPYVSFCTIE